MILGLGVDLLFLPRVAALVDRRGTAKFASRILSQEEYAFLPSPSTNNLDQRLRFLAVRWAVKEAAYKALYPTVKPTWKDLSYIPFGGEFEGSKPSLRLAKDMRRVVEDLFVSVSHDGEYIMASVLATKNAH